MTEYEKKTEKLVLAFDVGTQSTKALLIDCRGSTLGTVRKKYDEAYYSRNPNWAEQDPEMYYRAICEASHELREQQPEAFSRVDCTVLTVFRDSVVCLDKDGKPLRDCILWMDQRKVRDPKPIPFVRRTLFRLVGMTDTMEFFRHTCMCNWIAENEPEIWARTDKFVMLSTYLNYRMTGRLADSWAAQTGHVPFDNKARAWDKNGITRCLYDIPQEKLCELLPAGTEMGGINAETAESSGIPVGTPHITSASDKACETLGLGVVREDQAALSFGTSATVQFASRKYFEPSPFMPSYPAVANDMYNGEVQLYRGYWMVTWFKQNFAAAEAAEAEKKGCSVEEILNGGLTDVPAGCEGLMLLPQWTPGLTTPHGRGAVIGFSDVHTRAHLYRAVIEGLNFGLMEGLFRMEKRSGQQIRQLLVAGGGSSSAEICRITADMFGLPVSRIQTPEACALGAAMCAFVTRGVYDSYDSAIAEMVHIRDTFQPDGTEHELYRELFENVFLRYYRTLDPLHRRLQKLTARKEIK